MPIGAEQLKEAGFSEDEIRTHVSGKLREAGFNDSEIDNYFVKSTTQSEVPNDLTPVDKVIGTEKTIAAVPAYLATKAVKGLTGWITPSLKAAGVDTDRVLTEAEQYWGSRLPNLGSIPNYGVAPPPNKPGQMWPPTIERLPNTPIADLLGATTQGVASVAGPVKGTMKAAEPIVKPLEKLVRPIFQRIAKGMVGGGLLGAAESADKPENIPEAALESAGMFGAFEAAPGLRKIPGGIKSEIWPIAPKFIEKIKTRMIQSKAWRDLTPAQRVPVIQDFEETMRGLKRLNPNLSEVEIYQKYMKGNFMEDAISKFSRGESSSVFEDILEKAPEGPIETAATGTVEQEVPEFMARGERPLPATVKPQEPTELKRVPEETQPEGPIIGPEGQFVEGTGEVQRPYPGQQRLPGPIPLLQAPRPKPQPPSKPIRGPVGGSSAFFPEGAPIAIPPQPQLPMPTGPLPISRNQEVPYGLLESVEGTRREPGYVPSKEVPAQPTPYMGVPLSPRPPDSLNIVKGEGGKFKAAYLDTETGIVYNTGQIHDASKLPPKIEDKAYQKGVLQSGFVDEAGKFYTGEEAIKELEQPAPTPKPLPQAPTPQIPTIPAEKPKAIREIKDPYIYLDREIERYNGLAPKPEAGGTIPLGAGDMNYRWASDALIVMKNAMKKGASIDYASQAAKETAKLWIKKHNARRPKDVNWQRWEGSADQYIDNAVRDLKRITVDTVQEAPERPRIEEQPTVQGEVPPTKAEEPKVKWTKAKIIPTRGGVVAEPIKEPEVQTTQPIQEMVSPAIRWQRFLDSLTEEQIRDASGLIGKDVPRNVETQIATIQRILSKPKPLPIAETKPEEPEIEVLGPAEEQGVDKPGSSDKVANWVKDQLASGNQFKSQDLFTQSDKHFGGTQAQGQYSPVDAYDAMELGINRHIAETPYIIDTDAKGLVKTVEALKARMEYVPTQTKRTAEKDEFQQFSTPPPEAAIVAWVANIKPEDVVMEPSAGLGGIAVFAKRMKPKQVIVNELSPRRAELLKLMGFDRVTSEDAAQLNNILPKDIKPTVVVMNPPFSATAGRVLGRRKSMEGAKHIEQALKRLEPNGRLVAIVGEGMGPDKPAFRDWWNKIGQEYDVRANIGINGEEYRKYGTTFDNQIIVIDKRKPETYNPVRGRVDRLEDLPPLLEGVRNERLAPSQPQQVQPTGERIPERPEVPAGPRPSVLPTGGEVGVGAGEAGTGQRPPSELPGQPPIRLGSRPGVGVSGRTGPLPIKRTEEGPLPGERGPSSLEQPGLPIERDTGRVSEAKGSADELQIEVEKRKATGEELTDSIYEVYKPEKVKVKGSKPHPTPLVQSAAMAAVEQPEATYTPLLPAESITSGKISDIQLEPVVYAGQSHEKFLPNGERQAYFVGDGTGVGKGRIISAIMLDNWNNGRKKSVWISERSSLIQDARRDIEGIGWNPELMFPINKIKPESKIDRKEGILFLSYSTLARAPEGKQSRLDQVINWLGEDFDGVIAFDEAHNMGNAVAIPGQRGNIQPAAKALAGVDLQNKLKNSRKLYVSATGATELKNLTFAQGLGLWGEGTSFANSKDFVNKIATGGLMGMELVARDLKAMGLYTARNLSWDGIVKEEVECKLTDKQRNYYNTFAKAWQIVLDNVDKALELTESSGMAKGSAYSALYGNEQRFFNQVITGFKVPTVIKIIEKDLAEGRSPIISLVNTLEAQQERAFAKFEETEQDIEDFDLSPKETIMSYIEKSFPVKQYEDYTDENGNVRKRPVEDSQGNPVLNDDAVRLREELLDKLGGMKELDLALSPIDSILEAFGTDVVAEVTGRKRRLVRKKTEKGMERVFEKWSDAKSNADVALYKDGKKKILIFSEKGGTGASYHSDLNYKNQAQRNFILLQGGWRADKAQQALGRGHRTNEANKPKYTLPKTDIPAEARFVSSIARRLEQIGALGQGERKTGGQGIFSARDNLESSYAKDALQIFYERLANDQLDYMDVDVFQRKTGLKIVDEDSGGLLKTLPPVTKFLNRLLAIELEDQAKIFETFSDLIDRQIKYALEQGTFDQGMETLKAKKIEKASEEVVYRDERSTAETKYVVLDVTRDPIFYKFEMIPSDASFFVNVKSGKLWAGNSRQETNKRTGEFQEVFKLRSPTYTEQKIPQTDIKDRKIWTELSRKEARGQWEKAITEAPAEIKSQTHLITGTILPIWDRLEATTPRIMRVQTSDGERLLGRIIPPSQLTQTLQRLGAKGTKVEMSPSDVQRRIIDQNYVIELANEWRMSRRKVAGEERIEISGLFDWNDFDNYRKYGVFSERINYDTRYFIPTTEKGIEAIAQILKASPIITAQPPIKSELGVGEGQDIIKTLLKKEAEKAKPLPISEEEKYGTEGRLKRKIDLGEGISNLITSAKEKLRDETGAFSWRKKKGVTKEDIERTDTTPFELSSPSKILDWVKKSKVPLNKNDSTLLENIARIPLWVGKAHKEYKPIQDVIDDRFRDYHIIRNGYAKELLDSWEGLSKESLDKIGKIFWKEDELKKKLNETGRSKLTPEELRAYDTKHAVMDFIWKEHLPDIYLQTRLGKKKFADLDEVEQGELKKEINEIIDAGYWTGMMPHPRPGRYFAKASIPAKTEIKTKKGLPYKSESQLKEALRMKGLDPDKYNVVAVEDGWIAQSKVEDTFDTVWREHFDDILLTATSKGQKLGIPGRGYKVPGLKRKLEKNFPEALIEVGENTKDFAEQGYFEVSPEVTQELIGAALKRMGPEATPEEIKRFGEALTESVNDIFKVRGFMEHSMKRKGIPGFEKDNWQEAIINYVTGFAGFASKTIASRKLWDVWPASGIAKLPNLRQYAEKQIKDTFSNMDRADETIAKVRALMFYDFLGGVVKSAVIQPTSNFFNMAPRLTVDTNWATSKITAEMTQAAVDVLDTVYSKVKGEPIVPGLTRYQTEKAKRLSEGEQMALRELREDGTISTQLTDEVMGKVPREAVMHGIPNKVASALRWMFGTMENYNREVSAVVSYRVGRQLGKNHTEAVEYARDIINMTQGKYGRTNLPPFARGEKGKWLRSAYSFSFFPHNQLALYRDLGANQGPRGKYGLMKAFMALMFLGGLGAIPFYKELEKAGQAVTGKNLRSEIAELTGDWVKGINYGVPGLLGYDITGSIGIGLPGNLEALGGPPVQYLKRTKNFMDDVAVKDWQRAAEDFPLIFQAPRNILSAYRNATEGVTKRSGKEVVDDDFEQVKLTKWEAVGKGLGFQPVKMSEVYRKQEARYSDTKSWEKVRDNIIRQGVLASNREEKLELYINIPKLRKAEFSDGEIRNYISSKLKEAGYSYSDSEVDKYFDNEKEQDRIDKLVEKFNDTKPWDIPKILPAQTFRERKQEKFTPKKAMLRERVK